MVSQQWKRLPLKDVLTLQRGLDLPSRLRIKGNVPIVTSSGINGQHNHAPVKGPGVVTGRYGTIGEVFYVDEDFWPLNTTLYVSNFKGNDPLYCSFLLTRIDFKSYSGKSGVPGVNRNDLHEINVNLPPTRVEQQAISKALSNVDGLIDGLTKLIAKKRDIKTATMQQLLTGKTRLPGFGEGKGYKQTGLGEIPEDWDVGYLGQFSDITKLAGFEYSKHFNSYKDGGEIIVVRGTNITRNTMDLSDVKTIPKTTSDKLSRSKLAKDDLVFAYVGTIGPVYLIEADEKYHLGPNIAKITCKGEIDPQFLLTYFKGELLQTEMNEKISVGAQPSLSMTKIRSFKVIKPQIIEQQAIAQVLSDMDKELESLQTRLNKTKAIKQGMMQELLTGKTRLIDPPSNGGHNGS